MNLTPIEKRALEVIKGTRTGITASELGIIIWRKPGQWISARSQSSNRWARTAGKVAKRLERLGLAKCRLCQKQFRWFHQ